MSYSSSYKSVKNKILYSFMFRQGIRKCSKLNSFDILVKDSGPTYVSNFNPIHATSGGSITLDYLNKSSI